jgi:YHS domain-containing protein
MKIPLFSRSSKEAIDPVCHMIVNPDNANGGSWDYEDSSYYFCAPGCKIAFKKDPESYLSGEKKIEM